MKKKFLAVFTMIVLLFCASSSYSDTKVKGYTTKKGTYVAPYYRSNKNSTPRDNYSTKGNVNPYTGKKGAKKYYGK